MVKLPDSVYYLKEEYYVDDNTTKIYLTGNNGSEVFKQEITADHSSISVDNRTYIIFPTLNFCIYE